ncbi:MAG TPA: hypothetical protein DIW43_18390 [Spongiibacteraceae bacterium]|nr:hypothetical protein [Spongiibacteraceae bacterium]HCS29430.1 hypothetical protein [Spongiibacteraceae bacterium]
MNKWAVSILLTGAALLIGLFLLMKPSQPPATPLSNLPPSSPPATIVDFTIHDGQLADGPAILTVAQHAPVTLNFLTNQKDEAHLHGYDLSARLTPGEAATMTFIATNSGRFEIELHRTHTTLTVLEVRPRQ